MATRRNWPRRDLDPAPGLATISWADEQPSRRYCGNMKNPRRRHRQAVAETAQISLLGPLKICFV